MPKSQDDFLFSGKWLLQERVMSFQCTWTFLCRVFPGLTLSLVCTCKQTIPPFLVVALVLSEFNNMKIFVKYLILIQFFQSICTVHLLLVTKNHSNQASWLYSPEDQNNVPEMSSWNHRVLSKPDVRYVYVQTVV